MIAYIDGFNVYHGLMARGWGRYRWLDYRALIEQRILDGQDLLGVSYFTARVTHQPEKLARQDLYLRALATGVEVVEGRFELRQYRCPGCATWQRRPQEKGTDVSLAVRLVAQAYEDRYDTAYLVCADADLVPAVRHVREIGRRVVLIDPPRRHSNELADAADHHWHFRGSQLARAQLPDPVEAVLPSGEIRRLRRPREWC